MLSIVILKMPSENLRGMASMCLVLGVKYSKYMVKVEEGKETIIILKFKNHSFSSKCMYKMLKPFQ